MMLNHTQTQQHLKAFILAFDIGGTKMAVATATENREILERVEISTVDSGDGATALNRVLLAGQELVRRTKETVGGELVCVGVATIGITLPNGVAMSPNIPGWESLQIERSMNKAFPSVPIRIDNDVKAAALAELRGGALKDKDFGIYVNFGTGTSIAYTFEGRVLQGHNGASGEIAYFLRNKDERYGIREGIAPFEEFCGGKAIGLRASEYFGEAMTTKELFLRATVDERARTFIDETLQEIAFHLTNVIISWDPEIVVFGGGIVSGDHLILPYIKEKIAQFVPFPPELVLAHFERDAALYGAIELACPLAGDTKQ
jgi:glucokinase